MKALLTESSIDAEHVNIKGRNPLHELCRCGKENAAAICEFFLECMPQYPIDKPDLDVRFDLTCCTLMRCCFFREIRRCCSLI